ncbi:hypothetical protein [Streptomyces sp. NPDC088727]|uniref:hypothetical protein n=1 Tax=Streptomyces sp. NPDC088727 TaxID=3365875 RepID=UPI0038235757
MTTPPLPFEQIRPYPAADPGFRLDPNGRAAFRVSGHVVDVTARYTTEGDRTDYSATGEGDEVLIVATVDVAGVTVGRGWFLAEWHNPYAMRDALAEAVREAIDGAERKTDEMAAELAQIRTKRESEASK